MNTRGPLPAIAVLIIWIVGIAAAGGITAGILYDVYGEQRGGTIAIEDYIDQGKFFDLTIGSGAAVKALKIATRVEYDVHNENGRTVVFTLGGENLLTLTIPDKQGSESFTAKVTSALYNYDFSQKIYHKNAKTVYNDKAELEKRAFRIQELEKPESGFLFIIGPSDYETWIKGSEEGGIDGFIFVFPAETFAYIQAQRKLSRRVTASQLKTHIAAREVIKDPIKAEEATVTLTITPPIEDLAKIIVQSGSKSDYSDLIALSPAPSGQFELVDSTTSRIELKLPPHKYYEFSYRAGPNFTNAIQKAYLGPRDSKAIKLISTSMGDKSWIGLDISKLPAGADLTKTLGTVELFSDEQMKQKVDFDKKLGNNNVIYIRPIGLTEGLTVTYYIKIQPLDSAGNKLDEGGKIILEIKNLSVENDLEVPE